MENDIKSQLIARGSKTAKDGFENERDVIDHFNRWKDDGLAQEWLKAMGYKMNDIEYVNASKVCGHYKADVQVRVCITIKLKSQVDLQNLQVKLVSNTQGFNQIDKRWIEQYKEMWYIPEDVVEILKFFTGEISPLVKGKDKRRVFLSEISEEDQNKVINFFDDNKILIVSDLLKGRGEFSADWIIVILKLNGEIIWVLKSINEAMNVFGKGSVRITSQGSLKIGRITMQRKGGDNGRRTAQMLQFKINPVDLF